MCIISIVISSSSADGTRLKQKGLLTPRDETSINVVVYHVQTSYYTHKASKSTSLCCVEQPKYI